MRRLESREAPFFVSTGNAIASGTTAFVWCNEHWISLWPQWVIVLNAALQRLVSFNRLLSKWRKTNARHAGCYLNFSKWHRLKRTTCWILLRRFKKAQIWNPHTTSFLAFSRLEHAQGAYELNWEASASSTQWLIQEKFRFSCKLSTINIPSMRAEISIWRFEGQLPTTTEVGIFLTGNIKCSSSNI